MNDWLSYTLADFVPFSAEVYWRLVEGYNAAIWPLHILALALGVALIGLALRPGHWSVRAIWIVLAAFWAWTGWRFVGAVYQQVHVGADWMVWTFLAQAGLLLAVGLTSGSGGRKGRGIGLALAAAAVLLYPALPFMTGRPMAQAEVIGISPDPTALATLGLVAALLGGIRLVALMVIPLCWVAFSGLTLITLGAAEGWVLIAGGAVVLGGLLVRRPSRSYD